MLFILNALNKIYVSLPLCVLANETSKNQVCFQYKSKQKKNTAIISFIGLLSCSFDFAL